MNANPFPRPLWGVVRYADSSAIRAVCWLCNWSDKAPPTMDAAHNALDAHLDSPDHVELIETLTRLADANRRGD